MIHCFLTVCFCAYTCPNRLRDGAIGNPDLFEQDFEHYDIPEVPEKGFKSHFLLICRHKMFIFGVYRLL